MDNSPASPLPGEMLYPSRSRTDIQRTGRRSARVARIDLSDRYAGTGELSVLSLSVRNASASPVIPPPFALLSPRASPIITGAARSRNLLEYPSSSRCFFLPWSLLSSFSLSTVFYPVPFHSLSWQSSEKCNSISSLAACSSREFQSFSDNS